MVKKSLILTKFKKCCLAARSYDWTVCPYCGTSFPDIKKIKKQYPC